MPGALMAASWKAYKYREIINVIRLQDRKERLADWPVVHHNKGDFDELVRAGKPFILVTGHFALVAAYSSLHTFPVSLITIPHGIPGELSAIHQMIVDEPTSVGARVRFVYVGEASTPALLAHQLTTPNTLLLLSIDARNNLNLIPHRRPFAGYANYPCPMHAARLARLAQCPVVFYCATWDRSGRVRLQWSNRFDPPPRHDQDAETALTNALFDELEAAIGRHPAQYTWTTGFDRHWDGEAGRWRNRDAA